MSTINHHLGIMLQVPDITSKVTYLFQSLSDYLYVVTIIQFCCFLSHQTTPLHVAAAKDNLDAVKYLMDCGADFKIKQQYGVSE